MDRWVEVRSTRLGWEHRMTRHWIACAYPVCNGAAIRLEHCAQAFALTVLFIGTSPSQAKRTRYAASARNPPKAASDFACSESSVLRAPCTNDDTAATARVSALSPRSCSCSPSSSTTRKS